MATVNAQAVQSQGPIVGLVRADGLLLPFVEWSDSAFLLVDQAHVDPDVSTQEEWYIIDIDGRRDTIWATNAVTLVDDEMGYDWWGLLTDYSRPIQGGLSWPIERVAIATSVPVLSSASRELTGREALMIAWTLRATMDSLFRAPPEWADAPFLREARADSVVVHGYALRVPADDAEWVAFQATQTFWDDTRDSCDYGAVLTGWVRLGLEANEIVELRPAVASLCANAEWVERPLALFTWDGTYYVVVNVYGYEDEYPLLRVWRDSRLVIDVAGR